MVQQAAPAREEPEPLSNNLFYVPERSDGGKAFSCLREVAE